MSATKESDSLKAACQSPPSSPPNTVRIDLDSSNRTILDCKMDDLCITIGFQNKRFRDLLVKLNTPLDYMHNDMTLIPDVPKINKK